MRQYGIAFVSYSNLSGGKKKNKALPKLTSMEILSYSLH